MKERKIVRYVTKKRINQIGSVGDLKHIYMENHQNHMDKLLKELEILQKKQQDFSNQIQDLKNRVYDLQNLSKIQPKPMNWSLVSWF